MWQDLSMNDASYHDTSSSYVLKDRDNESYNYIYAVMVNMKAKTVLDIFRAARWSGLDTRG